MSRRKATHTTAHELRDLFQFSARHIDIVDLEDEGEKLVSVISFYLSSFGRGDGNRRKSADLD